MLLTLIFFSLLRRSRFLIPEPVPSPMNEHILESWFTHAQRLNLPRKCLDHIGHETMSAFNFKTHMLVHHRRIHMEFLADLLRQALRIASFQQNDVTADLPRQLLGCTERHEITFAQDGEPV